MPMVRVSNGGSAGLIVPDGKMLNLSATNLSIDNIPTASTSRQYNSFLLNTKDVNTIYAYANTQFYFNICYYSSDGSMDVSSTLVDNSGWKNIAINHNYDYMFMGAAYYATATFHF